MRIPAAVAHQIEGFVMLVVGLVLAATGLLTLARVGGDIALLGVPVVLVGAVLIGLGGRREGRRMVALGVAAVLCLAGVTLYVTVPSWAAPFIGLCAFAAGGVTAALVLWHPRSVTGS